MLDFVRRHICIHFLELFLQRGLFMKYVLFLLVAMSSSIIYADELERICGGTDSRQLSNDLRIGRTNNGCTINLISRTCAITAGHCTRNLKHAAFNVPKSIKTWPQDSDPKDIYQVVADSLRFQKPTVGLSGRDWAVVRLHKNMITNNYAGDTQGYYPVHYMVPKKGDIVRITGFGVDERKISGQEGNTAQQSSTGSVLGSESSTGKSTWGGTSSSKSLLAYDVDTQPGLSGGAVIYEKTGEIIGIHTYGMCAAKEPGNRHNGGTLFANKPDLQNAIKNCLASEEN